MKYRRRTTMNLFLILIFSHFPFNAFELKHLSTVYATVRTPVLQRLPFAVTSSFEAIKMRPIRRRCDFFRRLPDAEDGAADSWRWSRPAADARLQSWKGSPYLPSGHRRCNARTWPRHPRTTATLLAQFEDALVTLFAVIGVSPTRGTPSVSRSTTARETWGVRINTVGLRELAEIISGSSTAVAATARLSISIMPGIVKCMNVGLSHASCWSTRGSASDCKRSWRCPRPRLDSLQTAIRFLTLRWMTRSTKE